MAPELTNHGGDRRARSPASWARARVTAVVFGNVLARARPRPRSAAWRRPRAGVLAGALVHDLATAARSSAVSTPQRDRRSRRRTSSSTSSPASSAALATAAADELEHQVGGELRGAGDRSGGRAISMNRASTASVNSRTPAMSVASVLRAFLLRLPLEIVEVG